MVKVVILHERDQNEKIDMYMVIVYCSQHDGCKQHTRV